MREVTGVLEMYSGFGTYYDQMVEAGRKEESIRSFAKSMILIVRNKLQQGESPEMIKTWLFETRIFEGKQREQLEELFLYINQFPRLNYEALAFRMLRESEFMYMWDHIG